MQNNSIGQAQPLGTAANKTNADHFAAKIFPIIREIQASGVTTLRGVLGCSMYGACKAEQAGRGRIVR